ncbi:DUF3108 domain-containing protein [Variovorax saccharolyticus]|uniref:DUF3108 domain-containing protein n=1 Tax=Variovorax saccharolyticus TaxID=3053516 RepID=UPI0025787E1E|nr:DUF3108 domain-containing protein [Variovorax sp. J22R187]MDM0017382.1 DUF3108 domain-containing protein [Variovorax sp. J22R187]
MPTAALPDALDAPRVPWRGLALLTALVALAHLALLGLTPPGSGPRPSPLAQTFITRSIVIAPAPQPEPPAAAPVAQAPPPPRPVRPRPAPRPRPAVAPTPEPATEHAMPTESPPNDLIAQAGIDAGDATTPEPAASASDGSAASGASSSNAGAAAGSDTAGAIPGPATLQVPGSVRLGFAATAQQGAQPLQGVFGELVWLQDGSQYDLKLAWTFLFKTLRSQHSTGRIGPTGIEPLRFSDTRRTEVASHFDRDKGQVVFSSNVPSVMLLAGAQDRLSVVLQLGALLAGDPAHYPTGAVIAVQTVGPRDAEIWTFNVEGEEELAVPAGQFQARKLTRNPRKPFDDKIELWLAPALGWLPVRIRQTQTNGDFIDLQLRNQNALRTANP